jgi:hypothetical protein
MSTSKPTYQADGKMPWKHVGYRGFCEFVASDHDFFLLRRFGKLSARVLLALQDELSELEDQLHVLEEQLSDPTAIDIHNGSFREETSDTRLNLIREIDKKLRAYSNCSQVRRNYWLILTDELVLQHSALRARPRVAQKDIASVSNWFYNHNNAIHPAETEYINSYEDLFSIVPKFKTPLRRLLETSSRFRLARLWRKAPKLPDENIHYSSGQRIEIFVNVINTTLGMIMLVVPLWILAFVDKTTYRLAIITTFLVFFLCFVSFTPRQSRLSRLVLLLRECLRFV